VISDGDASLGSGELPSSSRVASSGALSSGASALSEATPIAGNESISEGLVAHRVGVCGTIASSVPAPELSGCVFFVDECGRPPFCCPASPCCGESSNSVRLSKTFLNGVACDASVSLESDAGAREATGTWREASAGAERITAPLMQVRDHNGRRRLSAR
jgi:hypothetical protein